MGSSSDLTIGPDPAAIFAEFVRRTNTHARRPRAADPRDDLLDSVSQDSAVPILLGRRRDEGPLSGLEALDDKETPIRTYAIDVVPDVRSILAPPPPPIEGSEHGEIPARELERFVEDMQVLLRYRHFDDVTERLRELQERYPHDLLLLRRITEFHLEASQHEQAKECLFRLASLLFERRNFMGMRVALEQILVLSPDDARAKKLLALLARRDAN